MLLYHLADSLCDELGCDTLRFDFPGNGHSRAEGEKVNRSNRSSFSPDTVEDVLTYVRDILGRIVVCVVGHSLGAATILRHAMENETGRRDRTFVPCYVSLCAANKSDFSELRSTPLLTIHGDADEIVPLLNAHDVDRLVKRHELRVIKGANHNFNGLMHLRDIVRFVTTFCETHSSRQREETVVADRDQHRNDKCIDDNNPNKNESRCSLC